MAAPPSLFAPRASDEQLFAEAVTEVSSASDASVSSDADASHLSLSSSASSTASAPAAASVASPPPSPTPPDPVPRDDVTSVVLGDGSALLADDELLFGVPDARTLHTDEEDTDDDASGAIVDALRRAITTVDSARPLAPPASAPCIGALDRHLSVHGFLHAAAAPPPHRALTPPLIVRARTRRAPSSTSISAASLSPASSAAASLGSAPRSVKAAVSSVTAASSSPPPSPREPRTRSAASLRTQPPPSPLSATPSQPPLPPRRPARFRLRSPVRMCTAPPPPPDEPRDASDATAATSCDDAAAPRRTRSLLRFSSVGSAPPPNSPPRPSLVRRLCRALSRDSVHDTPPPSPQKASVRRLASLRGTRRETARRAAAVAVAKEAGPAVAYLDDDFVQFETGPDAPSPWFARQRSGKRRITISDTDSGSDTLQGA